MVKIDVRRDYYADLGLKIGAIPDEIKKQFKKLALKYHPDRNPGKEAEFITKFQLIQAAHEVLSDPQQRMKYDTERLRAGYGKLYGPSQNPLRRSSTSNYPSSAAKTSKPFPQRPPQQATPSAGAQRYANYAKASPQKMFDEGQTRADAFRGFQGMKPGWSKFDPFTGMPSSHQADKTAPNSMPPGQAQRPQSAYDHYRNPPPQPSSGPSRSQSTRKKHGFAPGNPIADEPMARTYSNMSHRSQANPSPPFDGIHSSKTKTSAEPFSSSQAYYREEFIIPEFERQSSQYATTGGEKTYFSSAGLGHSASVRVSPGSPRSRPRTNPPSPKSPPSGRHHSASPKLKADRNYGFPSSTSSSDLDEDIVKPKATPKSRIRPHNKYSDFYSAQDWNPGPGEDSLAYPNMYFPYYLRRRSCFIPRPHSSLYDYVDLHTDNEYCQGHDSDSAAHPNRSYRRYYQPETATQSQYEGHGDPAKFHDKGFSKHSSHLFDGPMAGKTPLNGEFKSKSHDNLNKSFSASYWQATFDRSDPFAKAPLNKDQSSRSRTSPNRDRSHGSTEQSKAVPMTESRSEQPQMQAKHSTNGWTHLKDASWRAPHSEGPPQQANSRRTRSPKNPANPTAKPTVIPQPASVTTEAQEEEITIGNKTDGTFATEPSNDPEAMEIDEPVSNSASEPAVAGSNPSVESRHVPGEPSRPEWQPSMMGGQDTQKPDSAHLPTKHEPAPPSLNGNKTNGIGGQDGLFDLNNMSNVAPFTATNSNGIVDLGDIHANLPFESRSSNQNGIRHSARPREHQPPNPPKRPRQPPLAPVPGSHQLVLPRKAWDRYVSEFNTYMREWNDFNKRIIQHFNARQEAVETGLSPRWISAVGDSNRIVIDTGDGRPDPGIASDQVNSDDSLVPGRAAGGFTAYFRAVEEDMRAQTHWHCAWELHRECLLELDELRQWIRNGGKVLV
ncbi:hypothetical protein Egran_00864 [Elaphomyces granulatus]|uniref:J domain-containing protein n=1 Tax=Elaphomyces granulatus TaxID=519963 RepID=A0A232M4R9_9EURO|nr:hypothetical protein Egran_00864 [Elaphomyces granulatus]